MQAYHDQWLNWNRMQMGKKGNRVKRFADF